MKTLYMTFIFSFISASCATTSIGEQLNELDQDPGTTIHTVKSRSGDTTEFAIVLGLESDLNTVITTTRSESAETCETGARIRPGQLQWLEACDLALAEPNLGPENRLATKFNKTLVLRNLGKLTEAKNMLIQLTEEIPELPEAYYALATIEYDARNYYSAINYGKDAIKKGLRSVGRAYYIIGEAHFYESEFQEARRAYETGLKHNDGASKNLRLSLERLDRM